MIATIDDEVLRATAIAAEATELAFFAVSATSDDVGLELLTHIRPGPSTEAERAEAIEAFSVAVRHVVSSGGADRVLRTPWANGDDALYCLVALIRESGRLAGAVAMITKCRTNQTAVEHLARARRAGNAVAVSRRHNQPMQRTGCRSILSFVRRLWAGR